MPDFDFGLAYHFIDPAEGVSRQLRFQRNWAPLGDSRIFDGTGQLLAVIADAGQARQQPHHRRQQARRTRPARMGNLGRNHRHRDQPRRDPPAHQRRRTRIPTMTRTGS